MVSDAQSRPLKELAREIFFATLEDVAVPRLFERKLTRQGSVLHFGTENVDLAAFKVIWVISFGKAAWAMFRALADVLGERYRPARGIIVSNLPPQRVFHGFMAYQASHPYPNYYSQVAADAILENLRGADEKTLICFLISGGGSALVESPLEKSVTLEDVIALNRVLVGCGASIDEINSIRKHLSAVKGGRLAEAAAKAHQVTLLLSDVSEGNPATIASGPTLPDPTTIEMCTVVAERYNLLGKFPPAIRELFEKKKLKETPKPGAAAFETSQVFVVGSSRDVLHAAHRQAGARGFRAECEMSCDDAPLASAAECLFASLERMQRENPGAPVAVISGGEILCPVTGDGRGGRNQAFVLHAVERLAGSPSYAPEGSGASEGREVAVLSAGTDGIDGNSPAAGAVADGETLARAREMKVLDPSAPGLRASPADYFRRSDSFSFFSALDDTLMTGPLENNLRDLRLLLTR